MGRRDYRQPEGERQAAARVINVSRKTGCGRPGAMTAWIIMVLSHDLSRT